MGRDSNSRGLLHPTRFPGVRLKPLGHPSRSVRSKGNDVSPPNIAGTPRRREIHSPRWYSRAPSERHPPRCSARVYRARSTGAARDRSVRGMKHVESQERIAASGDRPYELRCKLQPVVAVGEHDQPNMTRPTGEHKALEPGIRSPMEEHGADECPPQAPAYA